ncbi:MAG: hypothetical protein ACYCXN_13000, partial [Acidimicrobiales bacterium]
MKGANRVPARCVRRLWLGASVVAAAAMLLPLRVGSEVSAQTVPSSRPSGPEQLVPPAPPAPPGGPLVTSSGSDASCPPTTSAAADSSTLSAPVLARALQGENSATVLWCPPASGAGRVTSYTVTAEPGGESVTADVPNDWAIV